MNRSPFLLLALLSLLFFGCNKRAQEEPILLSVNIIDSNGFSEIISSKDRLQQLEGIDFLQCLPYKKVMRIYSRNERGEMKAYITTYWPNGLPKHYLEIVNGRAFGVFQEWHENGKLKVDAFVIGGEADTSESALRSYLFDGESAIHDEGGNLLATMTYRKGMLEGESLFFHNNGTIWKKIPYSENKISGLYQIFLQDGSLLLEASYQNDEPSGPFHKYWEDGSISMEEIWQKGRLLSGCYFSSCGELVGTVTSGEGDRITFSKGAIHQRHHFENGVPKGKVETYTEEGLLYSTHYIQEGLKEGEEFFYFPSSPQKPSLLVTWSKGQIQGAVKSWYVSGVLESQREISSNKKNGLLSAWYRDGSLMMVEEYQDDRLLKGDYFRKGEHFPISTIKNGKGVATLFDGEGRFLRKVSYENGLSLPD